MSAETEIARAVTLCIKHGITPDRLAQLIGEREQAALRARAAQRPRPSPRQDAIRAILVEAVATGAKITSISTALGMYPQSVRRQLDVMIIKGTAGMARGADGIARYFADQAAADAWLTTPAAATVIREPRAAVRQAPANMGPRPSTKRSQILALAEQRPADGITANDVAELLSIKPGAAQAHLSSMQGHTLWRAKVRGMASRWFTTRAAADTWTVQALQIALTRDASVPPVTLQPIRPTGPVITPEGVPITRVPAPPGRYEVAANDLAGGFSACRPGINPLTGKAWA